MPLSNDTHRCIGRDPDDGECADCSRRLTPMDAMEFTLEVVIWPPPRVRLIAGFMACPDRRSDGARRNAAVRAGDSCGVGAGVQVVNVRHAQRPGKPQGLGAAVASSTQVSN